MRRTGVRLVTHLVDSYNSSDTGNDDTDRDSIDSEHDCPLCLFKEFNEIPCRHTGLSKPLPPLPLPGVTTTTTTANRFSFRTRTNSTPISSTPAATPSPPQSPAAPSAIPAHITTLLPTPSPTPPPPTKNPARQNRFRLPRPLRRKPSPTTVTLRELRAKHSHQTLLLRAMQSDEQLQRVYESQILAYLESPMAEMDALAVGGGVGEGEVFELE